MSDDLLASDADREHAVARLREASAEGRLTLEELVDRTSTALVARTHMELEHVTAGLPAPVARSTTPAVTAGRTRFVLGMFAPVRRGRRWKLGRRTYVLSLFAPTFLELGEASVETDEAVITVFSLFAPVNLTVPASADLEANVFTVFAPFLERGDEHDPVAGAPRVRVRGVSLFAPVFVKYGRS
jgi:hypothetical protein